MDEYDPERDQRTAWGGKWQFRAYLAAAILVLIAWGFALDACDRNCLPFAYGLWQKLTRTP